MKIRKLFENEGCGAIAAGAVAGFRGPLINQTKKKRKKKKVKDGIA